MKNQVDADKILNHIKYTKHWLDKADEDYKNKRFGNGAVNVGLARADLTAAWELALQFKTQVFHKMPKKARGLANWKSASAVGLLASGFIMAFMINQYAGGVLMKRQQNQPTVQTHAVVITEQASQRNRASAPAAVPVPGAATAVPATALSEPIATPEPDSAAAGQTFRKAPAARYYGRQQERRFESQPAAASLAEEPQIATEAVEPAVTEPATVEAPKESVRIITITPKKSDLDQIDLYTTANDSIMKQK